MFAEPLIIGTICAAIALSIGAAVHWWDKIYTAVSRHDWKYPEPELRTCRHCHKHQIKEKWGWADIGCDAFSGEVWSHREKQEERARCKYKP